MRRQTVARLVSADLGLAEARLALLEFLLSSDEATESMQYAVQWLAVHTPVRRALVRVVSSTSLPPP